MSACIAPRGLRDAAMELARRGESPEQIRAAVLSWADAAAEEAAEWADRFARLHGEDGE